MALKSQKIAALSNDDDGDDEEQHSHVLVG